MSYPVVQMPEIKMKIDEKVAIALNIPFVDDGSLINLPELSINYENVILPIDEKEFMKIVTTFKNDLDKTMIRVDDDFFYFDKLSDTSSYYGNYYNFISQCIKNGDIDKDLQMLKIFNLYDVQSIPCRMFVNDDSKSILYIGNNAVTCCSKNEEFNYFERFYKFKNKYSFSILIKKRVDVPSNILIRCELSYDNKLYFEMSFITNRDGVAFMYKLPELQFSNSEVLEKEKKNRKYLFFEIFDIIGLNPDPKEVLPLVGFGRSSLEKIYEKWAKFRNAKKKALLSGLM
jgi:hypothetical protein